MIAIGVGGGDAIDVMTELPVQRALAEADRRAPHRRALGLVRAEGRDPARRRVADRARRHGRDRRVLRRGRRLHHRDRQGDHLQHGCRDRRHHLAVPVRRAHGARTSRRRAGARSPPRHVASPPISAPIPKSRPIRTASSTRWWRSTSRRWHRCINGPDTPDLAHTVDEVGGVGARPRRPDRDLDVPHRVVHELVVRGHHARRIGRARTPRPTASGRRRSSSSRPVPSSVRATIERDGLLADLEAIGATVLANACGPCIGQWDRADDAGANTIVTSYNRNFPKRNDGRADDQGVRRVARDSDRLRAGRHPRVRPAHRRHRRRAARRARGRRRSRRGLRARRRRLRRAVPGRLGRRRPRHRGCRSTRTASDSSA